MAAKQTKPNTKQKTDEIKVNFCMLADALRLKNSYQEAVSHYLNAILINRNDENSYYGLGLCYKALENYAKAIKYLEKATEIKPDFYEAFYEVLFRLFRLTLKSLTRFYNSEYHTKCVMKLIWRL